MSTWTNIFVEIINNKQKNRGGKSNVTGPLNLHPAQNIYNDLTSVTSTESNTRKPNYNNCSAVIQHFI